MTTWTIVEFSDNSVEAVPSIWINNNKCCWPQYPKEKLFKAIKHCERPQEDWAEHDIKTFRNATYDEYNLARKKAQKAEETSDLNSDLEVTKRMPKKNPKFVLPDTSESEEETGSVSNQRYTKEIDKCPTIAISRPTQSKMQSIGAQKSVNESTQPTTSKDINTYNEDSWTNNATSEKHSQECTCCPLHKITGDATAGLIQQIYRKIVIMEMRVNEICIKLDNNLNIQEVNSDIWKDFTLPLRQIQELENFEEYLNSPENMKQSAIHLAKVGGETSDDFVKRATSKLITYKLASEYSFIGQKGKKIFKAMNMFKLLTRAGEHTPFKDKELEDSTKKCLKRAKERAVAEEKRFESIS